MKKSETSVSLGEDDRGVYSLRNVNFCNTYVDDEYRELRENIGSIDTLREQLLTEEHISCDYKLENGEWREAVFWKMEVFDNQVTKVIYYSQDLDRAMAKRMEKYHSYIQS